MRFFREATRQALKEYLEVRGNARDPNDDEIHFLSMRGRRIAGANTGI